MRIKFAKIAIPGNGGTWDYVHLYSEVDKQFKEMEVSENWIRRQRSKAYDAIHHKVEKGTIHYVQEDGDQYKLVCIQSLDGSL